MNKARFELLKRVNYIARRNCWKVSFAICLEVHKRICTKGIVVFNTGKEHKAYIYMSTGEDWALIGI